MAKKYLVTPALPYASGDLHLGSLLENIQVNIFARALRMAEEDVLYVCGIDGHGTPCEINAKKAGMQPDAFVKQLQEKHEASFKNFGIEFDGGYGSTHTEANKVHAEKVFEKIKAAGHIKTKDVEQLFDPSAKRFLSDRMVRGTCPKCKTPDQYGDNCEACGSTYDATDLIDPKSTMTGDKPVLKTSTHYFFELQHYAEALEHWTKKEGTLNPDVQKFLKHWFAEGLQDWDISRDGPYFGFKIPGEDNKYFYVWLDAPIGYISLSEKAAKERGASFDDYWLNKDCEIYNFIGKDIIYFHTLFWPAMLMAADYTLPRAIPVHGMLTLNGEKMSKSRGTFVLADTFAEHLDPETLRYYFACKLTPKIEDIDLSFEDFTARINSDLVNKAVNLLSRTTPLLHRYGNGKFAGFDAEATELVNKVKALAEPCEAHFRNREFATVCRLIVQIADEGNKYLQDNAPWDAAKTDKQKASEILSTALWVGKVVMGLLKPIMPKLSEKAERVLNVSPFTFSNLLNDFETNHPFNKYERLLERIDPKKVAKLMEDSKPKEVKEESNHIDIKDFIKVDLRAAKVLNAENVEGSDKLIALTLDVGPLGQRNVFSGLRPHVEAASLNGKTVALVANLKPRKMRFGMSEGMVLSSVNERDAPSPIMCDGANPGDKIC